MEFIWRPNAESLGTDTQLFTHVMYQHYGSPQGFGFDKLDKSEWTRGDQSLAFASLKDKAQLLINHIEDQAESYLTNEIFVVFGDDFRYMNAH